jgi:hypothetical protein
MLSRKAEKILKYETLTAKIQHMRHVKRKMLPVTTG